MKRTAFLIFFGAVIFTAAQAQQLTRFAVVDIDKVNVAFFKDSKAYRDWQDQSNRVQREIDRLSKEIQDLKSAQFDADAKGNKEESLRLSNEVYNKSEYLREYFRTKSAELDDQKSKLSQSSAFYKQINEEIRFIAESEGYTMVLNIKDASILWYSPSVDITDKLIHNLRSKN